MTGGMGDVVVLVDRTASGARDSTSLTSLWRAVSHDPIGMLISPLSVY